MFQMSVRVSQAAIRQTHLRFLSVTVSRSNFPIITNDTHTQSTFICMHDVSVCIFGTKTAFFAIKKNPHPRF